MEPRTNYTVVGLVVVVLIGTLIAAALWLSVGFDQKEYRTYAVHIHEAVSGLGEQSAVKYNGVKVGSVSKIELSRLDPQQVIILLSIEKNTPITTSTTATIISQGITGTSYVGLTASSSDLTPLQKKPNQPYPVIPATPSLFNQLDKVMKDVSVNLNKVSKKVSKVFTQENINNLNETLANIKKFTQIIATNNEKIDHSLKNMDIMLGNIAKASEQFPGIFTEMKTSLHQFNTMSYSVSNAGKSVTSAMDAGKIAIDKISQQTLPSATTLIERLNSIAANLEKVSEQMRQNPAVVIRGTTPPPRGPGE